MFTKIRLYVSIISLVGGLVTSYVPRPGAEHLTLKPPGHATCD